MYAFVSKLIETRGGEIRIIGIQVSEIRLEAQLTLKKAKN